MRLNPNVRRNEDGTITVWVRDGQQSHTYYPFFRQHLKKEFRKNMDQKFPETLTLNRSIERHLL